MTDIVWAGELAPDLVDLNAFLKKSEIDQHSQEFISNNTIDNALVAIPWSQEIGLLYYREDLLEKYGLSVPRTWSWRTRQRRFKKEKNRKSPISTVLRGRDLTMTD